MTYQELIQDTGRKFSASKVECGDFGTHSIDFILQVTGLSREKLFVGQADPVHPDLLSLVEKAAKRRLEGEPLQYIVGYAWFWNSKFEVGPGALIPRKETEHIVEYLLTLDPVRSYRVAELGAGTGNIGISILQERPHWEWLGFEINRDSLTYLKRNIEELLPENSSYRMIENDFFASSKSRGLFDLVVSNPPYISEGEKSSLSREVGHEPDLALYSGASGLDHIEKLVIESLDLLVSGGHLVSEIGSEQGPAAKQLALRHGFGKVDVLKDMAGLDRILVAQKNKNES